ncbi:MAG TPA: YidC/Oxa1 family insertase periplasmic-domain containing protein [Gemmatimonadaceae bacterium]|nr:YidC/Oxa1 family insertase periplasmic-domain containing protein [Gemmatimonadaceae bacterium]
MDRRTILALVLMAIVLVVTPMLFPSARHATTARPDTTAVAASATPTPSASATPVAHAPETAAAPTIAAAPPAATGAPKPAADSAVVVTPRAKYTLLAPGAVPVRAQIDSFVDLRPGRRGDTVVVAQDRGPLLHYRIVLGRDTIALDTVAMSIQTSGSTTTFTSSAPALTISYGPGPNGYSMQVQGSVANAPAGSALLIDLPHDFRSVEADTLDDMRNFAYGYKQPVRDVTSVPFSKLDSTQVRADTGSMEWVVARSKYWVVGLINPPTMTKGGAFHDIWMRGGTRVNRITRTASATTMTPLTNGQFAFTLYIGPQSWPVLHAMGRDLENVNPYASFLRPIIQPFTTIIIRVLLWMKANIRVNYGWVIVIFGVVIRFLLWPLYVKSMRTSLAMQRLQPELSELQKKYKSDPEKQREALMKVYQAHGMSPLSPMLGCLPMLLPMPILYAMYFVFRSTIEFRGVPFLWLPDLALRDPYYIIPIVMGLSMFLLSWIGMRAAPPNPQTKMMSYMMPAMFTIMFMNLASGLNLYYAVQNIASLPQQWLIAKERAKVGPPPAAAKPAVAKKS